MAITDWPAAERPRGKLLERGPTAQSDAELLAILLRTGLCAVVGLGGASVHPREVVRVALARNAAAVIFAHDHPSGVAEPSDADRRITGRLKDALGLVEIRVLDHLVVGDGAAVSLAQRGWL